jgi:Arc/MetJ family transcription regulator
MFLHSVGKIREFAGKAYSVYKICKFVSIQKQGCMTTNVEIDDALMEEAMELTRIKTKKQVIESALKEFIAANHRRQLMSLRGKVEWEGNQESAQKRSYHS